MAQTRTLWGEISDQYDGRIFKVNRHIQGTKDEILVASKINRELNAAVKKLGTITDYEDRFS